MSYVQDPFEKSGVIIAPTLLFLADALLVVISARLGGVRLLVEDEIVVLIAAVWWPPTALHVRVKVIDF